MKKEDYTIGTLLDVLECYRLWILKSGEEFPRAVLSDIAASTKSILKTCEYNKRIKKGE